MGSRPAISSPGTAVRSSPGSRELTPYVEQSDARMQDAIKVLACPADPRGPDYTIPTYGFTWYVGVYSNSSYLNNGIIVEDSSLSAPFTITNAAIPDGTSNTIMIAERPPPWDGQWGWWDSSCCNIDTIAPARGGHYPYSSGINGNCPSVAIYKPGTIQDNCAFNGLWANHWQGGNFCMGDGSVRTIAYTTGNQSVGVASLIEALASRNGGELVTFD